MTPRRRLCIQRRALAVLAGWLVLWLAACDTAAPPSPVALSPATALPTATAPPSTAPALVPTVTRLPPTMAIAPTAAPAPDITAQLDAAAVQAQFSGALLVAEKGVVVISKGYGLDDMATQVPNTPHTRFRLASLTKQFTAMAILILQERGKLGVQDHACAYLPDCPAAWQPITIQQLLTHSSGIPNYTDLPDYATFSTQTLSPAQLIARFKDLPLDFPPGTRFQYSNSGYALLGDLIAQVSGQSYEGFVQDNIFRPLQMSDSGYDHPDQRTGAWALGYQLSGAPADPVDMSVPYAAGALYSTVEDLDRWDQALDTTKLVSADTLAAMFTDYGSGYGYGWEVTAITPQRHIYAHSGDINGFSTRIMRYPDDQVTIIALSNHEGFNIMDFTRQLTQIVFRRR